MYRPIRLFGSSTGLWLNQTHAFTFENLERAFEDNALAISVVQGGPKLTMVNGTNTQM
jgi:hypothetical protein